ncbi:MAG: hypothetical protein COW76_19725 [Shewanella sp. CG18_big_fil_WC_8_21_14_2_50_42_11]|nr:MAG: hypothetical protein COW76_19725 [Shewanella sp. CG18_big_fil_WC_8_21_14_2_50_42_11]PIX70454.1 MAG: hypothetical protein COZ42_13820 [Shewanella sp. CG_4_10_14_3_um_filter_42_91]PIY64867.1 MAG: hypothetical protein COY92_15185 [Shewanella sp. CG_4_10_14_0_8_um_filter_42_13]PJB90126.1 MAG: hypothetical protein CO084_18675 [Shewanella sp. CG_4_9_14_0_8_um_filter_42_14]
MLKIQITQQGYLNSKRVCSTIEATKLLTKKALPSALMSSHLYLSIAQHLMLIILRRYSQIMQILLTEYRLVAVTGFLLISRTVRSLLNPKTSNIFSLYKNGAIKTCNGV